MQFNYGIRSLDFPRGTATTEREIFFLFMRYVYVQQTGTLGDYAKPLKRQNKTGYKRVQELQAALDQTVKMYSSKPATEENSQELWESLTNIGKKLADEMQDYERECDAYLEIEDWLSKIGERIAFGSVRPGITVPTHSRYCARFLATDSTSESFIDTYLKAITCITSLQFKNRDNAEALFAKLDRMTDSELIQEALKDKEQMRLHKSPTPSGTMTLGYEEEELPF